MTMNSEIFGEILEDRLSFAEPVPPFDVVVAKRFSACLENGFPICLDYALQGTFRESHVNLLKSITRNDRNLPNIVRLSAPRDIWTLYVQHITTWKRVLGKDSTKIVEFKSLERMKDLRCEECPMYELELLQLGENER
jgi:hypothetical protein